MIFFITNNTFINQPALDSTIRIGGLVVKLAVAIQLLLQDNFG